MSTVATKCPFAGDDRMEDPPFLVHLSDGGVQGDRVINEQVIMVNEFVVNN